MWTFYPIIKTLLAFNIIYHILFSGKFFYSLFFYTQMKKSLFLLGLLTTTLCLTACGSKNFNMSFEEAVETANHSTLQDILSQNDTFEQALTIAGNYDAAWTKVDANISSTSKQNLNDKNSESLTNFWIILTSEWETVKADWALDMKFLDNAIYLNISSLNLTWSEDVSMIAMMAEWFKNQWFVIPMEELNDVPNTFSVLKDSKDLDAKAKEIIVNEWSVVYNWKFTQFNWYNAWKFSIDNEKLNTLLKEYYNTLDTDEEEPIEAPELNIQNFEWYLIITWKDKITTVVENMDIIENEADLNVNGFWWDNYEINVSSDWEPVLTFVANKDRSNYQISLNLNGLLTLEGTVTSKISSSNIDISFNITLTIKSEYEETDDTIIPLKVNWSYSPIANFSVTAPESAQDLTEMLQAYLWEMLWWADYSGYEDGDYEDIDYWDYEGVEAPVEELTESVEENA